MLQSNNTLDAETREICTPTIVIAAAKLYRHGANLQGPRPPQYAAKPDGLTLEQRRVAQETLAANTLRSKQQAEKLLRDGAAAEAACAQLVADAAPYMKGADGSAPSQRVLLGSPSEAAATALFARAAALLVEYSEPAMQQGPGSQQLRAALNAAFSIKEGLAHAAPATAWGTAFIRSTVRKV
jgi:hypothetical protein